MPLLESHRYVRTPSYAGGVVRQGRVWLTGSAFAVVLAVITIADLIREFQLPLWVSLVALLVTANIAQLRAGLELRGRLEELSGALYKCHPVADEGIELSRVWRVNPKVSPLRVEMTLGPVMASRILVACSGPIHSSRLLCELPAEQQSEDDPVKGTLGLSHHIMHAEISTPQIFVVGVPGDLVEPIEAFLEVYADPAVSVVSIEWDRAA